MQLKIDRSTLTKAQPEQPDMSTDSEQTNSFDSGELSHRFGNAADAAGMLAAPLVGALGFGGLYKGYSGLSTN